MMIDVDALSRRFRPIIAQHCAIANILHSVDLKNIPEAYDNRKFAYKGRSKIDMATADSMKNLPVII